VGLVLKHEVQDHVAVLWINPGSCGAWWPWCFGPSTAMERSDEITADHWALALGLAVPAIAQDTLQRDPGRESPLAAGLAATKQARAQDCAGIWQRADVSNKGILEGKELDKFRSVLNRVDTNKDGKISQSEFMIACRRVS